jgi:uncharacterized protein
VLLENSFVVAAPIDRVWNYLLDVEQVARCMPGAELTEMVDAENYKGKVRIKLGPVSLAFAGQVTVAERDDTAHRVVLKGSGMEQRGKGRANVTVTATAQESSEGTSVEVVQDLQIQGQIASMSRGMMGDVSARLTKQFADCLQATLSAPEPAAAATPDGAAASAPPDAGAEQPAAAPEPQRAPSPAGPRGGDVNALALLWSALVGLLRRLVARVTRRTRA